MTTLLLSVLLLAAPEAPAPPEAKPDPQATIREILKLTDEQAAEVLPVMEAIEAERAERRDARREALRQLRKDVDAGAPDDVLETRLRAFEKAEAGHREAVQALVRKAEKALTVPQRARLLLLLERAAETGRDRPRPPRAAPGARRPVPRPAPSVPPGTSPPDPS